MWNFQGYRQLALFQVQLRGLLLLTGSSDNLILHFCSKLSGLAICCFHACKRDLWNLGLEDVWLRICKLIFVHLVTAVHSFVNFVCFGEILIILWKWRIYAYGATLGLYNYCELNHHRNRLIHVKLWIGKILKICMYGPTIGLCHYCSINSS